MTGRKSNVAKSSAEGFIVEMPRQYTDHFLVSQLRVLANEEALWDIDIVFRSTGTILKTSGFLLSLLSPFCYRMVCGAFKERADRRLEIGDVEASVFQKLFRIAYGIPAVEVESQAELIELARLADEFQMEEVRTTLEDKLLDHLSNETCTELLMASMSSGLSRVEQPSRSKILDDFEAVSTTAGFARLSEDALGSLLDDDGLVARCEERVFEGLARWLRRRAEDVPPPAPPPRANVLLAKIRFPQMDADYLTKEAASVLPGVDCLGPMLAEALEVKASRSKVDGPDVKPALRVLGPKALVPRGQAGIAWASYERSGGERRIPCAGLVSALAQCAGEVLCSGSLDGSITVWNRTTLEAVRTLQPEPDELRDGEDCRAPGGGGESDDDSAVPSVLSLAGFGNRLVSGHGDGSIHVWDPAAGRHERALRGHTDGVWALAPCGAALLLSGSDDRTIRVWDAAGAATAEWACARTLDGHTSWVVSLAVWQDGGGARAISGSMDNTIRVWDPERGAHLATLPGHTGSVFALVVVAAERRLVSGAADQTLRLWALGSWEPLLAVRAYPEGSMIVIRRLAVSGTRLVSGSVDVDETNPETQFEVRVWSLENLACMHVLRQPPGSEVGALLAVDGSVWAGVGEEIVIWGRQ